MTVVSAPRLEVPARPYAKIRGAEPSVTTILNLLPKPGLPWGAAKESARFAVLHPEKWRHLPDKEAVERIYQHHRGVWNGRAAMGTLCHSVNESYSKGHDVDIEALIQFTIENDPNARTWAERDWDELIETCLGYVLGIEKWWEDFQPRVTAAEQVVRMPGRYIGQTDWRGDIGGFDTLVDLKTTAKQDDGSGIYLDSWTLQLVAYGFAPETVEYEAYEEKGRTKVREVGTGLWTPPERCAVLHLRGDESYAFYEIPADKAAHETFLHLADAHAWLRQLPKEPSTIQGANR